VQHQATFRFQDQSKKKRRKRRGRKSELTTIQDTEFEIEEKEKYTQDPVQSVVKYKLEVQVL
jgi:hypothetical protein